MDVEHLPNVLRIYIVEDKDYEKNREDRQEVKEMVRALLLERIPEFFLPTIVQQGKEKRTNTKQDHNQAIYPALVAGRAAKVWF